MDAYLLEWLNLLVRWLHLIAGIAWIGASFYFIMLDNSLRPPAKADDVKRGVFGELWAVHGGGLYHSQKYLAGPVNEPLSEKLHWSKWEAYTTWMSGMGLLAIIYWCGASTYLIDNNVMALSPAQAIGISIGAIVGGWLVYNGLCRLFDRQEKLLIGLLFIAVIALDWALFQIFSARAAFIHVGAVLGTIMAANVFFVIIPGQKRMVADIRAGRQPDSEPGRLGKQRSVHNTYFTLPVLFIMISHHYPMTYSHPQGWLILAAMMTAGALIRQFFVLRHRGVAKAWLPVVAVLILLAVALSLAPKPSSNQAAPAVTMAEVSAIVQQRCIACHANQPTFAGFAAPPKGVVLESGEQIQKHAAKMAETVATRYMPIGNLTKMTEAERERIALWFRQQEARSN
ncbi:MAG: urate hydroxylase PuuD [Betaproteobacteria bacterium]|nr:urate hydroxylase PuuD [Betaproteobacteria bacterium]